MEHETTWPHIEFNIILANGSEATLTFIKRNTHHGIGQLILKGIDNKEMEHSSWNRTTHIKRNS